MYVMGDTSSSCSSPEFVRSSDADLADSAQEKRLKRSETELDKNRIEGDEEVRNWKSEVEKKTREMDERWKVLERREREVDKRKREGDEEWSRVDKRRREDNEERRTVDKRRREGDEERRRVD